jgi:hypothetical protein
MFRNKCNFFFFFFFFIEEHKKKKKKKKRSYKRQKGKGSSPQAVEEIIEGKEDMRMLPEWDPAAAQYATE